MLRSHLRVSLKPTGGAILIMHTMGRGRLAPAGLHQALSFPSSHLTLQRLGHVSRPAPAAPPAGPPAPSPVHPYH